MAFSSVSPVRNVGLNLTGLGIGCEWTQSLFVIIILQVFKGYMLMEKVLNLMVCSKFWVPLVSDSQEPIILEQLQA